MLILFPIDQKGAILRGIEAPRSTELVEVPLSELTDEARALLARRLNLANHRIEGVDLRPVYPGITGQAAAVEINAAAGPARPAPSDFHFQSSRAAIRLRFTDRPENIIREHPGEIFGIITAGWTTHAEAGEEEGLIVEALREISRRRKAAVK